MEYLKRNDLCTAKQHNFQSVLILLILPVTIYSINKTKCWKPFCANKAMIAIYTNFGNAFNKCGQGVIAPKVRQIKILGKIGIQIYNFLVGCIQMRQQVMVRNNGSNKFSATISSLNPNSFYYNDSGHDSDIKICRVCPFADNKKIIKLI